MNFLRTAFFFSVIFQTFIANAQERALGTWKLFLPYGSSRVVCNAGDKVFSAAEKSIFSYEKSTGVIQIYDKATGLNEIGIQTINYDVQTNTLVVAYANSNLDLIVNGTDVYNIPDIKNKAITGAMSIHGISFHNGEAYISSDIGISVINLSRKEIGNTYIIGSSGGEVSVNAVSVSGSTIYAATEEGVKAAPSNASNLQDFNMWHLYSSAEGIPAAPASFVAAYNQKVYAVIKGIGAADDTLYEYSNGTWSTKYVSEKESFTSLNVTGNTLYFTLWNDTTISGKNGKIDVTGNVTVVNAQHGRPVGWFEDGNVAWEAELWGGLLKNNNGNTEWIVPDGPGSSNVFDIDVIDGGINIAPGGVDDSWGNAWNYDGFFRYKNNDWSAINMYSFPPLADYTDILSTVTCKPSGKTYFGSFRSGLIEVDNSGNIQLYDKWNSILEEVTSDPGRTKISCLTIDKNDNVWIGNAGAPSLIKVIKPDGTWKKFTLPYTISLLKKMIVDKQNQIWALTRQGNGVVVFSYGQDMDNPNDDASRFLRTGSGAGALPDENVFSLAEDKDGNIWVGTNQGIGIFYCSGSVLTNYGCDASQIKVERDGYIGYLFGTESVRAIAVDAANRKWIGTTNGLWLISADGKQELLKFTTDNSPLPANQITDIAIDDKTGEVFIGTLGGIVSYQGDAMGECTDCETALVYPNPVKPDYEGPIAIKGLTEDAYVKITDVSGTLVYQGKANGSQMIWNGKGYNGVRAKSGVYLVFSSTDLGKEKQVAKILIAN